MLMETHMEQVPLTSDNELTNASTHIATQQEKLDAIFGITGGKTVDEFLDSLSVDIQTGSIDTLSAFDETLKQKASELNSIQLPISMQQSGLSVQICSMEHSLKEIENLVELSKDVMRHVADSILATPLIDSEAVQAYSKLLESIHINIAEFIGVYRDKQNFIDKVKFAMFSQEQEKEMALYKHNLALERIKAKDGPPTIDSESQTTSQPWSQERVTQLLNDQFSLDDIK